MTPQEEFIEIYNKYITRQGADELLEWLKRTDFFTAPASSKYHCACENGLVMHSVSVFNTMMEKHYDEETDNIESFAICGLLHDLCKAQFYKVSSRNVKNEKTETETSETEIINPLAAIIDDYKNVRKNEKILNFREFTEKDYEIIGKNFSRIAKENSMTVQTCFENRNLVEYGFIKGECLSHELAYKLTGKKYKTYWKMHGYKDDRK